MPKRTLKKVNRSLKKSNRLKKRPASRKKPQPAGLRTKPVICAIAPKAMLAKDVMIKDVIVAKVPGSRRDLLKLFSKHQISGAPVVNDRDGTLVGLVTSKDLFRHSDQTQLAMIMRKDPVTVSPETPLCDVVKIMVENRYHRIIVVDGGNRVIGIITPANIMPHMLNIGLDRPVDGFIRKRSVPIYVETPIFIAWRILKISSAYALPVLGHDGRIAGILTDRNFFGVSREGTRTTPSSMGVGEDEDVWTWESLKNIIKIYYEVSDLDLPDGPVSKIMTHDPICILTGSPVSKAAELMSKYNIRILPIIDADDNVVSSIADIDVISAIIE